MAHTRLIRAANDNGILTKKTLHLRKNSNFSLVLDSDTAEDEEIDVSVLRALKKSGGRALGFMPDNGEGAVDVWRVDKMDLAPVDPDMIGIFFGGDSYVIRYHYENKRGGQGDVIYYWQGKKSSLDEKAVAAIHAVRLDNELNGTAIQVRVAQGHEPRHFLKIFKGKMITFTGGHASGFNGVQDNDTYDVDGTRLFRLRGTCAEDVRADQMPEVAASLASDDAFILETPEATYVWHGAVS